MRIRAPSISLNSINGFSADLDIFQRRGFGLSLIQLVNNTEGELVLALNANWGEGKSTFLKMWKAEAEAQGLPVVVFDAFANDHTSDPFIAIASHIYGLVVQKNEHQGARLLEHLKAAGKLALRSGAHGAMMSGGGDEDLDSQTQIDAHHSDACVSSAIDIWLEQRIVSCSADQQCISELKAVLHESVECVADKQRIVFVIDELDRCRPDFALSLLEIVKHFFSVPGLVFVLSVSRNQLEAAIKKRYGNEVNANQYLQKFVHLWTVLPDGNLGKDTRRTVYIRDTLERMQFDFSSSQSAPVLRILSELAEYYELALREIEQSLSNYALFVNTTGDSANEESCELGAIMSVLKIRHPKVFERLMAESIAYDGLVSAAELEDLRGGPFKNSAEKHRVRWLMKAYLLADDLTTDFITSSGVSRPSENFQKESVRATCRVMGQFGDYS